MPCTNTSLFKIEDSEFSLRMRSAKMQCVIKVQASDYDILVRHFSWTMKSFNLILLIQWNSRPCTCLFAKFNKYIFRLSIICSRLVFSPTTYFPHRTHKSHFTGNMNFSRKSNIKRRSNPSNSFYGNCRQPGDVTKKKAPNVCYRYRSSQVPYYF